MAAYSKIPTLTEVSNGLHDSYNALESIPKAHLRKFIRLGEYYIESERRSMEILVGRGGDDLAFQAIYHKGAIDAITFILGPMKAIVEGEFIKAGEAPDGQGEVGEYDDSERNHTIRDAFFDE